MKTWASGWQNWHKLLCKAFCQNSDIVSPPAPAELNRNFIHLSFLGREIQVGDQGGLYTTSPQSPWSGGKLQELGPLATALVPGCLENCQEGDGHLTLRLPSAQEAAYAGPLLPTPLKCRVWKLKNVSRLDLTLLTDLKLGRWLGFPGPLHQGHS